MMAESMRYADPVADAEVQRLRAELAELRAAAPPDVRESGPCCEHAIELHDADGCESFVQDAVDLLPGAPAWRACPCEVPWAEVNGPIV